MQSCLADIELDSQEKIEGIDQAAAEQAAWLLLKSLGLDPESGSLQKTPERVAKMFVELTRGYRTCADDVIGDAFFEAADNEIVVVKNIRFSSLCEHHLLPFSGSCSVAYVPNGKIVGLSKVGRVVEFFARRLQVQEKLTTQIADFLYDKLNAQGIAVKIQAFHQCMAIRGVEKRESEVTTLSLRGLLKDDPDRRKECLALL